MKQKDANLRVCASCEWVFLRTDSPACPKCGFAHYGARFVYGDKAYRYAKTQEPWIKRKMDQYYCELLGELPKTPNNSFNLTQRSSVSQVKQMLDGRRYRGAKLRKRKMV